MGKRRIVLIIMGFILIVGLIYAELNKPQEVILNINGKNCTFIQEANYSQELSGLMNANFLELFIYNAEGMVFPNYLNSTPFCFWSHNTYIPLNQIWIENNTVVAVYEAQPLNDTPICYNGAKVIEIPAFFNVNVSVGDKVV